MGAAKEGDYAQYVGSEPLTVGVSPNQAMLNPGELAIFFRDSGTDNLKLRISRDVVLDYVPSSSWTLLRRWSDAVLKQHLLERGILVSRGRCRSIRIDWPDPARIQRREGERDDHLEMGINLRAAEDFLVSVNFPLWYARNDTFVRLNGKQAKGKENGYDIAAHIRVVFAVLGYECFSVVEVLKAAA